MAGANGAATACVAYGAVRRTVVEALHARMRQMDGGEAPSQCAGPGNHDSPYDMSLVSMSSRRYMGQHLTLTASKHVAVIRCYSTST